MVKRNRLKAVLTILFVIIFLFFVLCFEIVAEHNNVYSKEPFFTLIKSILKFDINTTIQKSKEVKAILKVGLIESQAQAKNILHSINIESDSALESHYIYIDTYNYNALTSDLPLSGYIEVNGYYKNSEDSIQEVNLRFRGHGNNHWHYTQKSWRVKSKKGELVDGVRKLNFVNPQDKSALMDHLAYVVGNNLEVLSVEVTPVRLFLNGKYMGIYQSTEQSDEYFLKKNNLELSEIYSGDLVRQENGYYKTGYLWRDSQTYPWDKMAEGDTVSVEDYSKLNELISIVNDSRVNGKDLGIADILDIEKYLKWKTSMIIAGSSHATNIHNYKLYYNPSSEKFEPILWDTDGFTFKSDNENRPIDVLMNDLDVVVFSNPFYVQELYKKLYQAINDDITEDFIIDYISDIYDDMKTDMYSDCYKDYTGALGMSNDFSNKEYDESIIELKEWIHARYNFMNQSLSNSTLYYDIKDENEYLKLTCDVNGFSACVLKEILLDLDNQSDIALYKDSNLNDALDDDDEFVSWFADNSVNISEIVYPSKAIESLEYTNEYDPIETKDSLQGYTYFITGMQNIDLDLDTLKLCVENYITSETVYTESGLENESSWYTNTKHAWSYESEWK